MFFPGASAEDGSLFSWWTSLYPPLSLFQFALRSPMADGSVSILFSICLLCGGQKAFLKSKLNVPFPWWKHLSTPQCPQEKTLSYFSMSLSNPLSLSFFRVFRSFKLPISLESFIFLFLVTLPEFFNLMFRYPFFLAIRDYMRSLSPLLPPSSRVIHTDVCPLLARR